MKRFALIPFCIALLSILSYDNIAQKGVPKHSQRPKQTPNNDYISAKTKRLRDLENDLLQFYNNPNVSLTDRNSTLQFTQCASDVEDFLDSISVFISIYSDMSCSQDKIAVEKETKFYIYGCARRVELIVKSINKILPIVNNPSISTTGIQVKDELREIKDWLDAFKFD